MACIAAFVVLLVLSAFSARHRKLLRQSWGCVTKRVTFRPCDTSFRDDIKTSALAPLALKAPRLVRPASGAIEVVAWVMVLSLVVSAYMVLRGGLNLVVYGTCDKQNPSACSLAAGGCTVDSPDPTFWQSLTSGDVVGAFVNEATSLGETISTIPSRFRTWDAADYAPAYASFVGGYRPGLPTALEVLDPGCEYCARLFRNLDAADVARSHNLTYVVYAIPGEDGPQFASSPLIARYLTAIRVVESSGGTPSQAPTDWEILRALFTERNADGLSWQLWFNAAATPAQAEAQLQAWLTEFGMDDEQAAQVVDLAGSDQVADLLEASRAIVEDEIRTLTIPTFIGGGRLHRGLVSVEDLANLGS